MFNVVMVIVGLNGAAAIAVAECDDEEAAQAMCDQFVSQHGGVVEGVTARAGYAPKRMPPKPQPRSAI